ncbi:MAG TPA: hypothetical protein VF796_17935 [Humisphaera sp.]
MSSSRWEYMEGSDRLLGEVATAFADRVGDLAGVAGGSIFLCSDQQRVELCWGRSLAVVGHSFSFEDDIDCAVTDAAMKRADVIPDPELLAWNCSCCGVSLGEFARSVHIGRDAAFEIFRHIITHMGRPDVGVDGPVIWMPLELK